MIEEHDRPGPACERCGRSPTYDQFGPARAYGSHILCWQCVKALENQLRQDLWKGLKAHSIINSLGVVDAQELAYIPDDVLLTTPNLGTGFVKKLRAIVPYQGPTREANPTKLIAETCPICHGKGRIWTEGT